MDRLLVRNARYVIDVDPAPVVRPATDVLVEDGVIAAVGRDLSADAQVLDATDRIVLPGFVDTHRHTWQAALRASTVDVDLFGYLDRAHAAGARFTPDEMRASVLAGALEAIDSGITTLQDFSHALYTPDHADATIDALRAAGLRAVFGYGAPFRAQSRDLEDVRRVRAEHFSTDEQLVTMAYAPLGPSYSDAEAVREDWLLARELGVPITTHVGAGPVAQRPIAALREAGLLTPGTLYVHGNSLPDDELRFIADSGGAVAITPAVEAQMGHGAPMLGRLAAAGVTTGLGVDVVTAVAGDMFSLMRAALLSAYLGAGRRPTVADILYTATLGGATALGLQDRIGSLTIGKQADLILIDAAAVNTAPVDHDPVAAVVTSAHPGNVDTVVVAGRVVKHRGRLLNSSRHRRLSGVAGVAGPGAGVGGSQ
ncbi:amidohydrolase family protein [Nocardia terpenica]|nr:amidohydrolase family protein [Nocardia terpenica]